MQETKAPEQAVLSVVVEVVAAFNVVKVVAVIDVVVIWYLLLICQQLLSNHM